MAQPALFIAGLVVLLTAALIVVFRQPLSRHVGRLAAGGEGVSPEWVRRERSRIQGSPMAMVWNAMVLTLVGGVMIVFGIFGR